MKFGSQCRTNLFKCHMTFLWRLKNWTECSHSPPTCCYGKLLMQLFSMMRMWLFIKIIWMHLQQQASCRHSHTKTDPLPWRGTSLPHKSSSDWPETDDGTVRHWWCKWAAKFVTHAKWRFCERSKSDYQRTIEVTALKVVPWLQKHETKTKTKKKEPVHPLNHTITKSHTS